MKSPLLRFLPLFFILFQTAVAGPGDTLVVQTFTWEWPVNSGWNSPKEGWFEFPSGDVQYEKILMYYKLKCDPSQNPACGEWDYLTYARLYDHTGVYDSNEVTHPNFTINGATPDTVGYMNSPSWRFYPRLEQNIVYDDTTDFAAYQIGDGSEVMEAFRDGSPDGSMYFLWTQEEMTTAGVAFENLTGLRFQAGEGESSRCRLSVRLRRYTAGVWQDNTPLRDLGWVTVYDGAYMLEPNAWNAVQFIQPFSYWSGDVLVEIRFDDVEGEGVTLLASDAGEERSFISMETDGLLSFDVYSHVNCGNFPELNDTQAFTLEAWLKPDMLRSWSNLIIRGAGNDNRIGIQFNAPESGRSDVYCLVGNGSNSYGRTENRPISYGDWVHIAMVYDGTQNTQDSRLRLYLNGEEQNLSFNGTIPAFTSVNDADLTISSPKDQALTGRMDAVRIWGAALSESEVREHAFAQLNASDPMFDQLLAAYNFNEDSGDIVTDMTGNHDGQLIAALRDDFNGWRVKGFTAQTNRPNIMIEQGTFTSHVEETLVIDTVENMPQLLVLFSDTTRPTMPTDSMFVWPPYYSYNFAPDGSIIDSQLVSVDSWLYREDYFYYDPFEIIDRYELGRYITPYGIGLDLGEGWTWVYDVTDFAPLLRDSVHLTAGNFQELLDMKFIFIEGTPPRDVLGIENVWQGTFSLKTFETAVPARTIQLNPEAEMFKLRTTATGHDFDNATNCAEFCPKIHSVKVNGTQRWSWQIIQECSTNPLYPQGGTWIYSRAGWCPGMEATTEEFDLTPYINGDEVEIDYDSQYDEFGRYVFESQLVSYGAPNHQVDAAVDAIIAPSRENLNRRFNPTCGQPRIVVQNRGEQPLTSMSITYGPRGGNSNTYEWTGSLEFMEKETVLLPAFDWGEWSGENMFDVRLTAVNGGSDEYAYNDAQYSFFDLVPRFDSKLVVRFNTNNAPNENRWEVLDSDGSAVYSRSGFSAGTTYYDTLDLAPGCYEIVLHDTGQDGISWWANNDGTGSFQFRLVGGGLWDSVNPDFGKNTRYPFRYSNLVAVEDVPVPKDGFTLYPNPASEQLHVAFDTPEATALHVEIYNMLGECVYRGSEREVHGSFSEDISTASLRAGSYVAAIVDGARILRRMKFSIVH
ncbi:T9SS type A sorting domain-containing protein [bacterium]|nr:T9SS type A sorting domain-containing protein [bacterium]